MRILNGHFYKTHWFLAVSSLVALLFLYKFTFAQINQQKTVSKEIIEDWQYLPAQRDYGKNVNLKVFAEIYVPSLASSNLRLKADDCLETLRINGQIIEWQKLSGTNNLCWGDGFKRFNFEGYLNPGRNTLEALVHNDGGAGGLEINPEPKTFQYLIFHLLLGTWFLINLIAIWKRKFPERFELITVALAFLASYFYLLITPWDLRTYDVGGHLEYITYILKNFSLPKSYECWECLQNPGYYLIAATLIKSLGLFVQSIFFNVFALQFFSLILMFIFLLKLREIWGHFKFAQKPWWLLAFLVTTPAFIIHSNRITNDILCYATSAAFLHATLVYFKKPTDRSFLMVWLFLFLAIASKASALPLLPFFVIVWAFQSLELKPRLKFKAKKISYLQKGTLFSAAVFFGFLFLYRRYFLHDINPVIVNQPQGTLRVGRAWGDFISLDFVNYFKNPWAEPWVESSGRSNFWNYFLKSFSFGEFSMSNKILIILARIRNGLFLAIFLLALFGWTQISRLKNVSLIWIVGFFAATLISSQMFLRFYLPYSCSSDARLTFPWIVGIISLLWLKESFTKFLLFSSIIIGFCFWITFFLSQHY